MGFRKNIMNSSADAVENDMAAKMKNTKWHKASHEIDDLCSEASKLLSHRNRLRTFSMMNSRGAHANRDKLDIFGDAVVTFDRMINKQQIITSHRKMKRNAVEPDDILKPEANKMLFQQRVSKDLGKVEMILQS